MQYEITSIYLENKAEIKCVYFYVDTYDDMYVCDNIGTSTPSQPRNIQRK